MKKFILFFSLTVFYLSGISDCFCTSVFAEEDKFPVLEAAVSFDWVNMEQVQRDEKIAEYHAILFGTENNSFKRKEFRELYKDFLKDKDFKTHYRLISGGLSETETENMSGFFKEFGKENLLIAYAIQPKKDLRHAYYYSAMGKLAYVDDMSENYPNFPYYSKQYRASGKLAGVIYFETKDLQYVYKPNGDFKGVWYKEKMFDNKGKEIMTRTNW